MNRPYVYKIIHKETKQYYIGYREANTAPAELDLGIKYFTSSKFIKNLGFHNFDYQVVAEFINPDRDKAADDAYYLENILIKECIKDKLCLNGHYTNVEIGDVRPIYKRQKGFIHSEETKEKMREARKKQVYSEESKMKMRVSQTGKKLSAETREKMSQARKRRVELDKQKAEEQ